MTKFLLDENLSYRLVKRLSAFIDAVHVSSEGLLHSQDRYIWEKAKEEKWVIITQDRDFQYLSLLYGCPPKVIKLNCENQSSSKIADLIIKAIDTIRQFILSEELCLLELK